MKTIWLLLIGMVLFNGFILAFNVFFEQSTYSSGLYNVEDVAQNETFNAYKKPGVLSFTILDIGFIGGSSVLSIGIGAMLTLATRNLQYVAAGGMIGLISGIWTASASIFADMFNQYAVLGGIYTLISIAIGIIVAILVLGIFTGQDQLMY